MRAERRERERVQRQRALQQHAAQQERARREKARPACTPKPGVRTPTCTPQQQAGLGCPVVERACA